MKWHNEIRGAICGGSDRIYDSAEAEELFDSKAYNRRELSLMKQENIRMALANGLPLKLIKGAMQTPCGYCFSNNLVVVKDEDCEGCKLFKDMNGAPCDILASWNRMLKAETISDFADNHKEWCKVLGIWSKRWM